MCFTIFHSLILNHLYFYLSLFFFNDHHHFHHIYCHLFMTREAVNIRLDIGSKLWYFVVLLFCVRSLVLRNVFLLPFTFKSSHVRRCSTAGSGLQSHVKRRFHRSCFFFIFACSSLCREIYSWDIGLKNEAYKRRVYTW